MRRLIFSLICSSGKAANVPKPTSVAITFSQIVIAFGVAGLATEATYRSRSAESSAHWAAIWRHGRASRNCRLTSRSLT
jgi:hypothetical protein